jgi:hypothetical protein
VLLIRIFRNFGLAEKGALDCTFSQEHKNLWEFPTYVLSFLGISQKCEIYGSENASTQNS